MAYDDEAIYFAFRCYDAEPDRIRTTISRRDNAWNDDWVASASTRAAPARSPITCSSTRAAFRWMR